MSAKRQKVESLFLNCLLPYMVKDVIGIVIQYIGCHKCCELGSFQQLFNLNHCERDGILYCITHVVDNDDQQGMLERCSHCLSFDMCVCAQCVSCHTLICMNCVVNSPHIQKTCHSPKRLTQHRSRHYHPRFSSWPLH